MADKWPLANGNWSNAANWNGGVKPVPGDDVYADSRTVTIDESIDVASLRTTARSGGTAGGGFTLASSAYTVSAATIQAGSSACLTITATSGTCYITGNIFASTSSAIGYGLTCSSAVSVHVTGNVSSSTVTYGLALAGLQPSLTVTGTVTGSVYNGVLCTPTADGFVGTFNILSERNALYINGAYRHNITISSIVASSSFTAAVASIAYKASGTPGTFVVSSTTPSAGQLFSLSGAVNAEVTGNISATATHAVHAAFTGTLTVIGNITGSPVTSNSVGINCSTSTSFVDIYVTGNVTGGAAANCTGISYVSGGSGSVYITGNVSGTVNSGGVAYNVTTGPRVFSVVGTAIGPYAISTSTSASVSASFSAIVGSSVASTTVISWTAAGTFTCPSYTSGTAGGVAFGGSVSATLTGTFTGASISANGSVSWSSSGSLTLNGDVSGGTGSSGCYGLHITAGSTITVNGNVYGGTAGGGTIGGTTPNFGLSAASGSAVITINGNVYGGRGNQGNNYGVATYWTGSLTVTGGAYPGSGSVGCQGVWVNSAGPVTVGVCYGSDYPTGTPYVHYGVAVSSTNWFATVGAIVFGAGGWAPFSGRVYCNPALSNYVRMNESLGGPAVTMGEIVQDYPVVGDVRSGTAFNFGSQTGTLAVPPASAVASGTPVDNTLGTAVLTEQNVADAIAPLMAAFSAP